MKTKFKPKGWDWSELLYRFGIITELDKKGFPEINIPEDKNSLEYEDELIQKGKDYIANAMELYHYGKDGKKHCKFVAEQIREHCKLMSANDYGWGYIWKAMANEPIDDWTLCQITIPLLGAMWT